MEHTIIPFNPHAPLCAFYSDTHLEGSNLTLPPLKPRVGLVIAAGDIRASARQEPTPVPWLAKQHPDVPVIFVPGNHEFETRRWQPTWDQMEREARGTNVHVMRRRRIEYGGVRILGTPLWSGFRLPIPRLSQEEIDRTISRTVGDFSNCYDDTGRPWTIDWMRAEHERDVAWLSQEIDQAWADRVPVLVVTHFAPSPQSTNTRFKGQANSGYWANPLDHLVRKTQLWIHGHTHDEAHYVVDESRPGCGTVLCHPRGWSKLYNLSSNNEWKGGPKVCRLPTFKPMKSHVVVKPKLP